MIITTQYGDQFCVLEYQPSTNVGLLAPLRDSSKSPTWTDMATVPLYREDCPFINDLKKELSK